MMRVLIYFAIALLFISSCQFNPMKILGQEETSSSLPTARSFVGQEETLPSLPKKTARSTSSSPAQIALVIGNNKYEYRELPNPVNDANAIANALENQGFEVLLGTDLDHGEMRQAINTFQERLSHKNVGLFYFAGHGVQIKGENYLMPINNARIDDEIGVQNHAVPLNEIVDRMEGANSEGVNMIILDACRDNPFQASRSLTRSLTRGLASLEASGMFIAYATSPGKTASDGNPSERHGLYTQHLLNAIQTGGIMIETLFKKVNKAVKEASYGSQKPWSHSSLTGDFCFGGCKETQGPTFIIQSPTTGGKTERVKSSSGSKPILEMPPAL